MSVPVGVAFFCAFYLCFISWWSAYGRSELSLCCTRRKSRRNRRTIHSPSRWRRRSGQRHASCDERNTMFQPFSYASRSASRQNKLNNNVFKSSTPSFDSRSERVCIAAPSRPLQTSRRPEDHEIEILLCALPTIRCSESDERMCSICLDSLSNALATMGSCGHPVHTRCLKRCFETSGNRLCPVCKARLFVNYWPEGRNCELLYRLLL